MSHQELANGGRERFGSRLGFILISAGCAIGLGNVWRFPYVTGQYGGAAFVILYLLFLVILGLPIMIMELSVGRGSQRSCATAFQVLQPKGAWKHAGWISYIGCMLLMMFYTTVGGWMVSYVIKMASGQFSGLDSQGISQIFFDGLGSPSVQVGFMVLAVMLGFLVNALGLKNGVERINKIMMVCLLGIMVVLVVRCAMLSGSGEGLRFYLIPDFGKLFVGDTLGDQMGTFVSAVLAAMGQAFFTLSLGIGSMEVFGSYIDKERSLTGEALSICALDTGVALMAGLIIFPACFAFGVSPDQGPALLFVTLPSVFNQMAGGQIWGTLFFVFMSFAALSTIIAVFENLVSWVMDKWGLSRKRSVAINLVLVLVLSLPCALSWNILSGVYLPGVGDIQAIEDFIVSCNLLPIGSLVFLAFCISKRGWGWDSFLKEADAGEGVKFPSAVLPWIKYGVPALIVVIFVAGYIPTIMFWLGC